MCTTDGRKDTCGRAKIDFVFSFAKPTYKTKKGGTKLIEDRAIDR